RISTRTSSTKAARTTCESNSRPWSVPNTASLPARTECPSKADCRYQTSGSKRFRPRSGPPRRNARADARRAWPLAHLRDHAGDAVVAQDLDPVEGVRAIRGARRSRQLGLRPEVARASHLGDDRTIEAPVGVAEEVDG